MAPATQDRGQTGAQRAPPRAPKAAGWAQDRGQTGPQRAPPTRRKSSGWGARPGTDRAPKGTPHAPQKQRLGTVWSVPRVTEEGGSLSGKPSENRVVRAQRLAWADHLSYGAF